MTFQKKKIQIETLSEYLSAARQNLKLSIKEVSEKTGIKPKFLESLESSKFMALPADVYISGFLHQLAQLYSADGGELVRQYKKEKNIQSQIAKESDFLNAAWYKKYLTKLVITPKILSLTLGSALVVFTFLYVVWQVWSINRTPFLKISAPLNNSVIAGGAVQIKGSTDAGNTLSINDQNVFVDTSGNFETQLGLTAGPKEIIFVAKNRFGKFTSKTIRVTGSESQAASAEDLELKLSFTGEVSLVYSLDGMPTEHMAFKNGDVKIFSAQEQILISTSNAGATVANLNGQNFGPLGREGESLNNVPFAVH